MTGEVPPMDHGFWTEAIQSGPVPEQDRRFDAIVVGGGPGGAAAATRLALMGRSVLLIEKGVFPRDKVCGDAVGGKSLSHVADLGIKSQLEMTPHFRVTGILFGAPKGHTVRVPLPEEDVQRLEAGYALPRIQFDWLLFHRATEVVLQSGGAVIQQAEVRDVLVDHGRVTGVEVRIGGRRGDLLRYHAPWTIGAGGYLCPVARKVVEGIHGQSMHDRAHTCAGWREYWDGVQGCGVEAGDIEIHFVDGVLPGYFWLFPVAGGRVNVGMGMVVDLLDRQKGRKLRAMQRDVIAEHPVFKRRFEGASLVEGSGRGWQLPFGSPRRRATDQPRIMHAPGALLIGDAASLVDPFSGEGIGNALVSAEIAARHVKDDIGGEAYQREVWTELGPELTNSARMQRMARRRWLLNWFVRKAGRKPALQEMMTEMIASKEAQGSLHSPWFIARTLLL